MNVDPPPKPEDTSPDAKGRKKDHIQLAFQSQTGRFNIDRRFHYEPMISGHPPRDMNIGLDFLGKKLHAPIWISSMTGGTLMAKTINKNLAKACHEFGLGMGLGSCRSLLYSNEHLSDFKVRSHIGDQPLYANLGIAQVDELVVEAKTSRIGELIQKLDADGLIVHVNPLQEWLQPEGDKYYTSPILTLKRLKDKYNGKLIVKEVGQGFGPKSLKALLDLEPDAIDFAAHGGTNFSKIELTRGGKNIPESYEKMTFVGHTAEEMVEMYNAIAQEHHRRQVIISGGVKDFLDGYYLISKCQSPAIYGQASGFLKHAMGEYEPLSEFVRGEIEGYKMAACFLTVKTDHHG